ncbi:MAG: hypothetical protein OEZ33_00200 [Gammaproteobacteria bacterium]|nr:hypothetical protein [Gammaproteobacteria bacterium]MDH5776600.1 hypothetical protein [Gammaproteobacteria bacterium]
MNIKVTFLRLLKIAIISLSFVNPVYAGGSISVFAGVKMMEEETWAPVDSHQSVGAMIDFDISEFNGNPLRLAVDYFSTEDTGSFAGLEITGETTELNIGVRVYHEGQNDMKFYFGGGLAMVEASYSGTLGSITVTDSDEATGAWFNAGAKWYMGENFHLGVDMRVSFATVNLYGIDGDAGGTSIGLIAGASF